MTVQTADTIPVPATRDYTVRIKRVTEAIAIPIGALIASGIIFAVFLLVIGKNPIEFYGLIWTGGFGSSFSIQNTPPARGAADPHRPRLRHSRPHRAHHDRRRRRARARRLCGGGGRHSAGHRPGAGVRDAADHGDDRDARRRGIWIGIAGWLRHYRGVNETISSLLLSYIAIAIMNFFVEGALRDPASANKPSTMPIGDAYRVGSIPGTDVHWGLAAGILLAILLWVLMTRTTFGFAARMTGGNARAAQAQGLPVGRLIVACCVIAGACVGPRRLLRGRGDPRPGQCLAGRRLRLHRHPRELPRAA